MKLDKIKFAEGKDGAVPETVTVTMTLAEATAIAVVFGKLNGYATDRLGLKAGDTDCPIYSCLVGNVYNRYWDAGVTDVFDHAGTLDLATINEVPE